MLERLLSIGVADGQQMCLHLVVFLHLVRIVLDLLLHVETVLDQVPVILLQPK